MKQILIFGDEQPNTAPTIHIGDSYSQVKYFTSAQVSADINCLGGYSPDLIINLCGPSEELFFHQKNRAFEKNANIVNLY